MNTYLAKLYPVEPLSELTVVELDCLYKELNPPVPENYLQYVKDLSVMYDNAVLKHGKYHGLTNYNNSIFYKAEARNIFEFIVDFNEVWRKHTIERILSL